MYRKFLHFHFVVFIRLLLGKLITSRGPATTFDFALKITELLVGKAMRDEVAKATLYKGNN